MSAVYDKNKRWMKLKTNIASTYFRRWKLLGIDGLNRSRHRRESDWDVSKIVANLAGQKQSMLNNKYSLDVYNKAFVKL